MAAAAVQQVEEEALLPEAATAVRQTGQRAARATPAPFQPPSNTIIIISTTSGTSRIKLTSAESQPISFDSREEQTTRKIAVGNVQAIHANDDMPAS